MSYVLWIIGGVVAGLSAFYLADKASALLHRWMPRFSTTEWHAYLWTLIATGFLVVCVVRVSAWWAFGGLWIAYHVVVLVREHRALVERPGHGV